MNIAELTNSIINGISPYLDLIQINISFRTDIEKAFYRRISPKDSIDFEITIFYTKASDNFTTTFYHFNQKPKTTNEVIEAILKAAKEQKIPLKTPEKMTKKGSVSNPEVF